MAWAPSVVEPTPGRGRGARRLVGAGRPRRHPRGRRPADRHRAAGLAGRHRQAAARRAPTRPRRPGRWPTLVGIDAGAVRQGGQGGRAAGVRRGDRVPPGGAAGRGDAAASPRSPAPGSSPPTCRSAPTRDFAAPLLGRVGEVTAEIIAGAPGVPPRRPGRPLRPRGAGTTSGCAAPRASASSPCRRRAPVRELFRTEATPGDPLVLSLDIGLETKAEELLAGVGPASALVAIRPSTGEILAAANGPGNGGQNLATFGQFAPGLDVQDRQQPGPAARRADAGHRGALHPDDHGRRQAVQELLRLPEQRARRHPAADRGRQLVQHRVHLAGARSCRAPTCSTPASRSASGSTTTSASRRTSARPTPTPRARPARRRS